MMKLSRCAFLLLLTTFTCSTHAACTTDEECVSQYGSGSVCDPVAQYCRSPIEQGCLYNRLPGWNKKRTCNSDDPPNAAEMGLCEPSPLDYMEIRIISRSWDSGRFNVWLVQLILSELLGVPTTVEEGSPTVTYDNLYRPDDQELPTEWANYPDTFSDYEATDEVTDCRLVSRANDENFRTCAHFSAEAWNLENTHTAGEIERGWLEPHEALGMQILEGLFIPRLTVERDPSVLNFVGLMGDDKRQKLAEMFKRPTTWLDYCQEVSTNNCTTPDDVAQRAPADEDEELMYFSYDAYTGHFRITEQGDCELNPTTCTGHFIDYPCSWWSFAEAQMHHLNIPLTQDLYGLEERGYYYTSMLEIINAANATKSNIMLVWSHPDPTYAQFIGTDFEFLPVTMPPVTKECLDNRRALETECSANLTERFGDPRGVCESVTQPLGKLLSSAVRRNTFDPSISEAARSPALLALESYTMTNALVDTWFAMNIERNVHRDEKYGLQKEITCDWAVENIDYLQRFVPATYPRVISGTSKTNMPFSVAAITLGCLALFFTLITAAMVYINRQKRVIMYAQVSFLRLLLIGLVMISVGSIISGISPQSQGTCIATAWFINLGYTMELAPLLVKVEAINRLMNAARQMRRIQVNQTTLMGFVAGISGVVSVFLLIWTTVDPLNSTGDFVLTENVNEEGETIVEQNKFCSSKHDLWEYVAVGWTGLLLFCATVLAFQARNVREQFNESRTLGIMTYSHFMFTILRLITFFLSTSVGGEQAEKTRSILYSLDTICTVCMYFVPKFFSLHVEEFSSMSTTFASSRNFGANANQFASNGQLQPSSARSGRASVKNSMQASDASSSRAKSSVDMTSGASGASGVSGLSGVSAVSKCDSDDLDAIVEEGNDEDPQDAEQGHPVQAPEESEEGP